MTDLQLLLSIGIQSLLIALNFISNNSRFNSMDKRMDGMDTRLAKFDADVRDFRTEDRQDLVAIHVRPQAVLRNGHSSWKAARTRSRSGRANHPRANSR